MIREFLLLLLVSLQTYIGLWWTESVYQALDAGTAPYHVKSVVPLITTARFLNQ